MKKKATKKAKAKDAFPKEILLYIADRDDKGNPVFYWAKDLDDVDEGTAEGPIAKYELKEEGTFSQVRTFSPKKARK